MSIAQSFTIAHEPDPTLAPSTGYHSILCAVELNREADVVLRAAGFLAQAHRARLCMVHVESPSTPQRGSGDRFRQMLQEVLSIDAAAIEERVDLVVVGRGREKGGVSRIWSHLYAIIRESPCPVLSV